MRGEERMKGEDERRGGEDERRGEEEERRSGLDFNVVRVSVSDPWRELVPQ